MSTRPLQRTLTPVALKARTLDVATHMRPPTTHRHNVIERRRARIRHQRPTIGEPTADPTAIAITLKNETRSDRLILNAVPTSASTKLPPVLPSTTPIDRPTLTHSATKPRTAPSDETVTALRTRPLRPTSPSRTTSSRTNEPATSSGTTTLTTPTPITHGRTMPTRLTTPATKLRSVRRNIPSRHTTHTTLSAVKLDSQRRRQIDRAAILPQTLKVIRPPTRTTPPTKPLISPNRRKPRPTNRTVTIRQRLSTTSTPSDLIAGQAAIKPLLAREQRSTTQTRHTARADTGLIRANGVTRRRRPSTDHATPATTVRNHRTTRARTLSHVGPPEKV